MALREKVTESISKYASIPEAKADEKKGGSITKIMRTICIALWEP